MLLFCRIETAKPLEELYYNFEERGMVLFQI